MTKVIHDNEVPKIWIVLQYVSQQEKSVAIINQVPYSSDYQD